MALGTMSAAKITTCGRSQLLSYGFKRLVPEKHYFSNISCLKSLCISNQVRQILFGSFVDWPLVGQETLDEEKQHRPENNWANWRML